MSYIGNPIISTDFPKDTFSGNGSTTAFTMSIAPASVNAVIVVVSGITQDPSTYTISGTTLTFSGAPPTGTSNISVRHLGVAGVPNTPSAGSVVATSIADGVITAAKFASGQTPTFNGITFPATQVPSADANTLDDYEEGTWTPTVSYTTSDGNLSYATQVGRYTKVGNIVTITGQVVFSETTASGSVRIASLPFTSVNVSNYRSAGGVFFDNMATIVNAGYGRISENSTLFVMVYADVGGMSGLTATQTGASANIQFSITYQTA